MCHRRYVSLYCDRCGNMLKLCHVNIVVTLTAYFNDLNHARFHSKENGWKHKKNRETGKIDDICDTCWDKYKDEYRRKTESNNRTS